MRGCQPSVGTRFRGCKDEDSFVHGMLSLAARQEDLVSTGARAACGDDLGTQAQLMGYPTTPEPLFAAPMDHVVPISLHSHLVAATIGHPLEKNAMEPPTPPTSPA